MPDKERRSDVVFFIAVVVASIVFDSYFLWWLFGLLLKAQLTGGENY